MGAKGRRLTHIAPVEIEARFWAKVDRSGGPDACWPWTAGTQSGGYGVFHPAKGQTVRAHRYALAIALGRPLAPMMQARHYVCDNPPCCNPAHLREGSNAENVADMVGKHRQSFGTRRPSARLTESGVLDMRIAADRGVSVSALAHRFEVSEALISMVIRGQRWKHVGGPRTRRYNTRRSA
ncbi:MAG: hypothetical protein IJO71_09405 [Microbacterium sp.]|uniref:hypothetical protein n=1 Tax=Microbacterium sp. TaxID=51671 RepID=UPI0025D3F4B9|nr:hypothetical protein [Microbacterium sp.]MBQ9917397.1 hypothetical protein [Microbacterium sp.]